MKLSVCTDGVFFRQDPVESIKAVKEAGCNIIEFWEWRDKDIGSIKKTVDELQMEIAAIMTDKVSLTDSVFRDEYVKKCSETIQVAKELGCGIIIATVGDEIAGVPRDLQHQSIVEGLKRCAPMLEEAGITLVIEPLNVKVDLYHGNYFLWSSEEAFQIVEEIGSTHVKVLYDIYHQQISEGNIINTITANIDKIGHIHGAGHPGRHEITKGEINYKAVIEAIKSTNYEGFFGLEYVPTIELTEAVRDARGILDY
ncbi:hydroxypyruvate isomerase [Neobacillus niacini]|uniref:hydroxypyruvate isomerase family protein n=1 Tax=Neobacillus driksii TaxID=3035913 RepID=UPI00277D893A|nr:TIM barrel protein [Neobacillus niacini]MDQ0972218.1 hydroxypyruvate isomerase [Neobacillus niacini]